MAFSEWYFEQFSGELKRIAIVVKYFPTVSETFIVNQINGLIDKGNEVTLYAYNRVETEVVHESIKKHDLLRRVHYFVKPPTSKVKRMSVFINWIWKHFFKIRWARFFNTLNIFRFGKDAYTLKLFFESQWFLIADDFDIIHSHFGMNGNRVAYVKGKKIISPNTKLVTTFHGYDLEPNRLSSYKDEYAYLLRSSNAFTVNTPYLKDLLENVNEFHIPVHVLPMGLDTKFFKRKGDKRDTTTFDLIFCGKLISLKGPDLAIEIVRSLRDKGNDHVRLHLVGDGVMRAQLEQQVRDHKLEKHVMFHGKKTQEQLKDLMENADAFLLPGRRESDTGRMETQGLVIQEAQAMELPVIVSDVGGMKYGLMSNESGFVIREEDVSAFTTAIESLILDARLKTNMGIAGRKFVEDHYDIKVLDDRLEAIYKMC